MILLGLAVLGKTNEPYYMCDCTHLEENDDLAGGGLKGGKEGNEGINADEKKEEEITGAEIFGFAGDNDDKGKKFGGDEQCSSMSWEHQFMIHSSLDKIEEIVGASHPDGTMPLRRNKSQHQYTSTSSNQYRRQSFSSVTTDSSTTPSSAGMGVPRSSSAGSMGFLGAVAAAASATTTPTSTTTSSGISSTSMNVGSSSSSISTTHAGPSAAATTTSTISSASTSTSPSSQHWVGWIPTHGVALDFTSQDVLAGVASINYEDIDEDPTQVYCLVTATNTKFIALARKKEIHDDMMAAHAKAETAQDKGKKKTKKKLTVDTTVGTSGSVAVNDTVVVREFLKQIHAHYVTYVMNPFSRAYRGGGNLGGVVGDHHHGAGGGTGAGASDLTIRSGKFDAGVRCAVRDYYNQHLANKRAATATAAASAKAAAAAAAATASVTPPPPARTTSSSAESAGDARKVPSSTSSASSSSVGITDAVRSYFSSGQQQGGEQQSEMFEI